MIKTAQWDEQLQKDLNLLHAIINAQFMVAEICNANKEFWKEVFELFVLFQTDIKKRIVCRFYTLLVITGFHIFLALGVLVF